jgi:DNA modification methylase
VSRKAKGTESKTKADGKAKRARKSNTVARTGKAPGRADAATPAALEVKITAARGRPMLTWVGKRPLRQIQAFPAQLVETFSVSGPETMAHGEQWVDWPDAYPRGGLLFHGDNKEVLAHLLANGFRGKVSLVYIDPPFDSGADYVRQVALRGSKGTAKFDGEGYTLGEQIQYTDIWANDTYLQFMFDRLLLLKELIAEDGVLYLHTGWHKHHHLRMLLDEVFGADAFRNEIVVKRGRRKNLQSQFDSIESLGAETDCILLYARTSAATFGKVHSEVRATEAKWKDFWRGNVDRKTMRYPIPDLNFPEPARGQLLWKKERGLRAAANYVEFLRSDATDLETYWRERHAVYQARSGHPLEFVSWDGKHNIKYWIPPKEEGVIGNLWSDIEAYSYRHDYRTEKHEALLRRIVEMGSAEGDIVLDCFLGSGTTAAVAQQLGRRWIGADINTGAIQVSAKRLQGVMREQRDATHELDVGDTPPPPAQLSFTTWRVNDYDLQLQHNEATNLAAEFLGVQRTRTDPYFDGTLGKALVKVVPFGRPLTPLDLEELKRELDTRRDEDREVTIVCLGMELAAKHWVDDWNALRKGAAAVNRIRVIELRTDSKYGGFLRHEPATARVTVRRSVGGIVVEITDFISPSIVERLRQQAGLLSPKIDDWRAMVDCVMIDPAYDGRVFNVVLSDVPERKQDLVRGRYELPAPAGKTAVAVKIVDMLGEEVLSVVEC